ncbi:UNVERIFIED_ORG: FSR family fosmidomycin resistance protein-like MFS transporter [Methylobacterium sp. SuP10 SLI 274]|uniref:MFS transporter n=1 Tax=Methylorubrum extorquens TaxID=408 RepID=UPI0020A0F708|nr:MFS transporter [Methylorubrum extorquens]MDF9865617.1 FSR family fosmidomycin resistance protein-like MFS transporter [Methylorubrum pseudosasae]MDH6639183.1 FSR family fosmidomycin resistance protein-like MFS transporter [Methylobacterium sp. SuP10 SLI 274]MDH6668373.1 FSR family fosmidomycin resistance protein-like MFS transporter [Methylorubrum zatmanii]MCP1560259.1 MFS family permease [Methylorubrum extorquens]MDF9793920.1 FSR family fosmidomycin resistance protein-like MFS transporter
MSQAVRLDAFQRADRADLDLKRRSLGGACLAHALHDGYTDLLYVLLPVWQAEFSLGYAGLAVLRSLYYATMGGLQIPADRLAARWPIRMSLAISTLVAAAGFGAMALSGSLFGLCAGLVLAGIGASLQHPRASLLVAQAYGGAARGPLGIYNFAGDLGKAVFPVAVALLLGVTAWRPVAGLIAAVGLAAALALVVVLPRGSLAAAPPRAGQSGREGAGFTLLMTVGAFDTATRMGTLLFLPFLLEAKGGTGTTTGLALALVFSGGAFGKAVCGWLGERLGIVPCVVATETATALGVAALLVLPLGPTLALLPLLGLVLNGTSSVLYGTVPDLAPRGDVGRAFALFYTAVIGSGGLAPIAYGALGDRAGSAVGLLAAAATALAIVPLVLRLRRPLAASGQA